MSDALDDETQTDVCKNPVQRAEVAHSYAQTDRLQTELDKYTLLEGSWIQVPKLTVDDFMQVDQDFLSGEQSPTLLVRGIRGVVTNIDIDHDYTVFFPEVVMKGASHKLVVMREDVKKVKVLRPADG